MQGRRRWIWLGVGLLVLIVLTLVAAPQNAGLHRVSIQRWQKPIEQLTQSSSPDNSPPSQSTDPQSNSLPSASSPITLLQIDSGQGWLTPPDGSWVEQGNVVIQLGNRFVDPVSTPNPITEAPFTTVLSSTAGNVKIQTSRRFTDSSALSGFQQQVSHQSLLEDTFGKVVFEVAVGKGRMIFAVTPYLAANAYQNEPGNFKFLSQLVSEPGYPVWVDEYLHGYKDADVIATEQEGDLVGYLAKTPIGFIAVQAIVILLVLVWGLNQRFGPTLVVTPPKVDNSEAYIRALAAVLQKANCSEFVVQIVGKAEQLQVQRSLGLGTDLLDPANVIHAWNQQTGQPASDLEEILQFTNSPHRLSEAELLIWLRKVQTVRQHLS